MARPKSAATRLEEALEAAEAGKRKLAELHTARNRALLADNDVEAMKLAAEIDLQEQTVRGVTDKIELLKAEAEKEASEKRAKERAALIERIEEKLKQRDEIGRELGETVKKADALFCKLFEAAKEIRAAWPWAHHDMPPTLLGDSAIARAVEYELYRCGARPAMGGGMDKPRPPSFPGGKSPTAQLMLQPDRIVPLAELLRDGSRMASEIMKTGKASGTIAVTDVPPPLSITGGVSEELRTDDERELSALLMEQLRLSEDVSPAGEQRYQEHIAKIVAVQSRIDERRALAANRS